MTESATANGDDFPIISGHYRCGEEQVMKSIQVYFASFYVHRMSINGSYVREFNGLFFTQTIDVFATNKKHFIVWELLCRRPSVWPTWAGVPEPIRAWPWTSGRLIWLYESSRHSRKCGWSAGGLWPTWSWTASNRAVPHAISPVLLFSFGLNWWNLRCLPLLTQPRPTINIKSLRTFTVVFTDNLLLQSQKLWCIKIAF